MTTVETSAQQRLDEAKRRIERIVREPQAVVDRVARIAQPLFKWWGWAPKLDTTHATALCKAATQGALSDARGDEMLAHALEELLSNVAVIERACVIEGRAPMHYVAWLERLHRLLSSFMAQRHAEQHDAVGVRSFAHLDPTLLLRPLELSTRDGQQKHSVGQIDVLLDAARAETSLLGRRRRLLEAARQALLDADAALELREQGVAERLQRIARDVIDIDRLQAAGVSPDLDLAHQARTFATRNDRRGLYSTLVAIEGAASRAGDTSLSRVVARSLAALGANRPDLGRIQRSLVRSARDLLDPSIVQAFAQAHDRRRLAVQNELLLPQAPGRLLELKAERAEYEQGIEAQGLLATMGVDGCFDVGGPAVGLRADEEVRRKVAVRYPTQEMVFVPAESVDDITAAQFEDPRRILHDLAANRLLARRYLAERVERSRRTRLSTEVRVYVLDGSGSMRGPRACMRDAILIAELSTLIARRKNRARFAETTLYYRYFTELQEPTRIVRDERAAIEAIDDIIGAPRRGGTDIEAALLASFEQIREARATDADLTSAQIVLVTDGDAPVNLEKVETARAGLGELPIGVSVIALGDENPALRELCATQRRAGDRIFYHFLSDDQLRALCEGWTEFFGPSPHLPASDDEGPMSQELKGLVDELSALTRNRSIADLERAEEYDMALAEVGLSRAALDEATLAREEAVRRDAMALERRFDRWFPEPKQLTLLAPPTHSTQAEELETLRLCLLSVAELVGYLGGSELMRRSDAIELMQRLCADAGLSPSRYDALMREQSGVLGAALRAVRATVLLR